MTWSVWWENRKAPHGFAKHGIVGVEADDEDEAREKGAEAVRKYSVRGVAVITQVKPAKVQR